MLKAELLLMRDSHKLRRAPVILTYLDMKRKVVSLFSDRSDALGDRKMRCVDRHIDD